MLSDTEKRRIYDIHGEEALQRHIQQQSQQSSFNMFGYFPRHCREAMEGNRGPDFVTILRTTLEDIYFGKQMEIKYTKQGLCPHCRGSGAEDIESIIKCTECNGQGFVMKRYQVGFGFYQTVREQ